MKTEPQVHEGDVLDSMPAVSPSPAAGASAGTAMVSSGDMMMTMAQQALSLGKVAEMRELLAMRKEFLDEEARKAFVAAMADFKAEAGGITIAKSKRVSFQTSKGKTEYDHAELHNITRALVPIMAKYGLSHRWIPDQSKGISITCVLSHRDGHSESVSMSGPPDDSGGKNSIQAIASTKSYLERYTLLAATGMATGGEIDRDGQTWEEPETEFITEEQEIVLRDLMDAYVNNKPKFLSWVSHAAGFEVTKLCEIPATAFDIVHNQLKSLAKEKANA